MRLWKRWESILERGLVLEPTMGRPLGSILGSKTSHHTPQLIPEAQVRRPAARHRSGWRAWMGNGGRTGRWAGSGSGRDTFLIPEDPFPPAQSCCVWEVQGKQRVYSGVIQYRFRNEPAEFPEFPSTNERSLWAKAEKWAAVSMPPGRNK